jgi:soluble lytic murein transglycosylase
MPTVPSLDPSQLVTPTEAPDVQSSSAVTAGLLDQGTQQNSDAGAALSQASDATSQIAIDAQARINQTRVDDANNQVQAAAYQLKYDPETGYVNKTGAAAITPDANGILPADAAVAKLNDTAQSVRDQLTPEQQRQFDMSYGAFSTNFAGEALAHEGQQTKQYSLDTNNNAIQLAQAAAAQDYSNPALLDNHVASAGNAAYKNAQVQGLQGDALTQTVKQSETSAIMAGYNAAVAKGDFNSASAIQSKYGSFLTADAAVEVDRQQTIINNNLLATSAAARASLGPQVATSPSGQAFAANVQVESGGKQSNADGTPLTSSKGAVGIAQVLPATAQETAQKHGIPWDPAKFASDPTYNRLLGQTYWQDQLAANGGDVSKADAAYNAGPGALQDAIAKATTAGTPNAWLQNMPPETQAYVQKVAAVRQSGVAPFVMPTKLDVINAVQSDPTLQSNPIAMKAQADPYAGIGECAIDSREQWRRPDASPAGHDSGDRSERVPRFANLCRQDP